MPEHGAYVLPNKKTPQTHVHQSSEADLVMAFRNHEMQQILSSQTTKTKTTVFQIPPDFLMQPVNGKIGSIGTGMEVLQY